MRFVERLPEAQRQLRAKHAPKYAGPGGCFVAGHGTAVPNVALILNFKNIEAGSATFFSLFVDR